MALQCKLFAGDPKLEAAAVSESAHITQGAQGDHVGKIQAALQVTDNASIDADGAFGSQTSAAVLAFKTKRRIINSSYQTQPDNIVGKMTIAALDAEMLKNERKSLDIETDTDYCKFRRSPHHTRLNFDFTSTTRKA